jgi:hypothetical protein
MRFSIISLVFAIALPFVSAVDDSLETNLKIEKIVEVGCKRTAQKGDKLLVHYHGELLDGKIYSHYSHSRGLQCLLMRPYFFVHE